MKVENEGDYKLVGEDVHLIVKTQTLNGVTSRGSNLTIICEKLDRLFRHGIPDTSDCAIAL